MMKVCREVDPQSRNQRTQCLFSFDCALDPLLVFPTRSLSVAGAPNFLGALCFERLELDPWYNDFRVRRQRRTTIGSTSDERSVKSAVGVPALVGDECSDLRASQFNARKIARGHVATSTLDLGPRGRISEVEFVHAGRQTFFRSGRSFGRYVSGRR